VKVARIQVKHLRYRAFDLFRESEARRRASPIPSVALVFGKVPFHDLKKRGKVGINLSALFLVLTTIGG
jgi:hypothetical protein